MIVGMGLRIVLAEDDYLVREGITALCDTVPGLEVAAAVSDLPQLLSAVAEHEPDVVLTDVRMPPTQTDEGVRAARQIRARHPLTGVVVLSQYVETAYVHDLLSEGAEGLGYLLKERVAHIDDVVRALEEVARGGTALDPRVVSALVAAKRRTEASPLDLLSPREHDVLARMAEGGNNARIAAELGISVRGVEKHINSLFATLGIAGESAVHHRVKAVLLFLQDTGALEHG